jgi:hypothetical protein
MMKEFWVMEAVSGVPEAVGSLAEVRERCADTPAESCGNSPD